MDSIEAIGKRHGMCSKIVRGKYKPFERRSLKNIAKMFQLLHSHYSGTCVTSLKVLPEKYSDTRNVYFG